MLLPRTCPLCGRRGPAPCAACAAQLDRAPALPPPAGVDVCVALVAYEDAGRELIARLKYRNARSALRWLVVSMATLVQSMTIDAVTWVPTTRVRRRDRGFDQAELLARGVARELHVPCRRLLARAHGPPQTGRSASERRIGPVLAARAARMPAHVLLVDDVITTGTTVTVAARALRAAGVGRVSVLSAARTPLRGRADERSVDVG
jgi:ComF family protein